MSVTIRLRAAAYALVFLMAGFSATAQGMGQLFVRPDAEFYFPLDSYQGSPLYSTFGMGGGSILDFTITPWLAPFVRGQYASIPYAAGGASLQSAEGDLGLGFTLTPADKLYLRLEGMGGLAQLFSTAGSGAAFSAGGRLGVEYRFAPSWTVSATGGYSTLFGTQAPILSAIEAGIDFSYDLSALGGVKARLSVEDVKLDAVFPSLYAYYDDNAFGTVKVVNREDAAIRDVSVTFDSSRYMDQPKVCGKFDLIPKGGSATVPIKALFTDSVLDITQNIDAKGEIVVEYSYLGSDRVVRTPVDFQMHHRNAITWSDDRRAAAFVSPTNPAAMWFSKFAAGIARDRLRGDINKPLQYAIAMFEAERAYGLNYVVVPANDYSVKHGLKGYIDSVQFPHQTLSNRGGDCSDLAILFTTLMQSVGVVSAFITIPGHIFAAFDTGLDEADAREDFYDPGLFILRDGEAWIPVEITMVNDGFIKAWRVAAKEWSDNSRKDLAAFYRLPDCWKVYPSAAFPNVNPRFALPDVNDVAMDFDQELDRFVAREIDPEVQSLDAELAKSKPDIRENEFGILYAHYGLFADSWGQLSDSAKASNQKAWTNLGNVAYIRKDFKLALSYYQWSYNLDASDDLALLGIARCQYELEDFDASDAAYSVLKSRNPDLAGRFGYLGSAFGGPGRAWSLADRFASTTWASTLVSGAPAAPAPAVAMAPAPAPAVAVVVAPASAPAPVPSAPVEATPAAVSVVPAFAALPPVQIPEPAAPVPVRAALSTTEPAPVKTIPTPVPAEIVAPAEAPAPGPSPVAPPAIAELPVDRDLAQKAPAAQKAAEAKAAEAPAPGPSPVAPPAIAELPVDRDLAQKAPASQKVVEAKAVEAPAPSPSPVAPPAIAELPVDRDLAQKATAAASLAPAPVEAMPAPVAVAPASVALPEVQPAAPAVIAPPPAAVAVSPQPVAPIPLALAAVKPAPASSQPEPGSEEAPAVARAEEANPPVAFQPAVAPASDEAAAPASPVTKLLIDGFGSAVPVIGEWKISGGVATQTDPDAFFAKLETPLVQDRRSFSYSFSAKSDASRKGWVGVGFHAFTPKSYTQKGYGSGDSLLVWLTRDPVHFKKDVTRLQLYRSTDDWNMSLLDEVPVTESIYDLNRFDITVDPVAGTVSVSMNGTERMVAKGILDLRDGIYVVFRSLDTAEFSDFKAEETAVPAAAAPAVAEVAPSAPVSTNATPAAPQAPAPSIGAVPVPQPEAPQPAEFATATNPPVAPQPEGAPPVPVTPAASAPAQPPSQPLEASPVKELLLEGFDSAVPVVGQWTIAGGLAMQTDPDAFFAKLATPLVQDTGTFSYSFSAKSDARGRGWAGVGFHAFTPKSYTQKGFGSGDSLCVWLTRDPVHYAKDVTRLQLYRSTDDWNMDLLNEVPVTESIYDLNRFEVTVDPVAGTVSVSMNGTERLVAKGILDFRKGIYVVFRSLDRAEFSDFKAEVSK